MKKLYFSLAMLMMAMLAFAQDYAFTVTKTGEGKKTAVFIPGFASSGDVWAETVSDLQPDYNCYVLTMPGCSGTPAEEAPSFESWKNQIAAYIKSEGLDKPVLVGHSMGGGLALAVAADYPEIASKLIVVDALPCLPALQNPNFKANPEADYSAMIAPITNMSDEQFLMMQKSNIGFMTTDSLMFDKIVNWSVTSDRNTFARMYAEFSNTDLRERIKTIEIPSLILLESMFKNIKPMVAEQYKDLNNAQLEYADKGLHFIMYDDKEWYTNQLTGFLND